MRIAGGFEPLTEEQKPGVKWETRRSAFALLRPPLLLARAGLKVSSFDAAPCLQAASKRLVVLHRRTASFDARFDFHACILFMDFGVKKKPGLFVPCIVPLTRFC